MPNVKGEWLILGAAVLWGTTGTAQALAPAGATPATVGAVRLAVGGLLLLAIALASRSLRPGQRWPIFTTLLAAGCIAGYQVFFFAAVAATGVAVGTIVGIGSSPVIAGALAWFVERRAPGLRWGISTALAVLGCTLLAVSGGGLTFQLWGILLALGAGAAYAFYTLFGKRLVEIHPPEAVMGVIFSLGALMLAPLLWIADLHWLSEPRGWIMALHLGIVATALSYTLFGRGLKTVPVATAVTLSLAEPLTAGLLGVFLLGEQLAPGAWVGVLMLFGALALLSL